MVKFPLKISLILSIVVLLSGCGPRPYTDLANSELQQLLKQGVPLIDIRLPDEWRQTGVVKGTIPLTFFDRKGRMVESFLPNLERVVAKEQPLILICRTGNRTSAAAQFLATKVGYSKVYHLQKGITDWIGSGLPVERLRRSVRR